MTQSPVERPGDGSGPVGFALRAEWRGHMTTDEEITPIAVMATHHEITRLSMFTEELVNELDVDRFTSLISTFQNGDVRTRFERSQLRHRRCCTKGSIEDKCLIIVNRFERYCNLDESPLWNFHPRLIAFSDC